VMYAIMNISTKSCGGVGRYVIMTLLPTAGAAVASAFQAANGLPPPKGAHATLSIGPSQRLLARTSRLLPTQRRYRHVEKVAVAVQGVPVLSHASRSREVRAGREHRPKMVLQSRGSMHGNAGFLGFALENACA
jgi:hypothetical protein